MIQVFTIAFSVLAVHCEAKTLRIHRGGVCDVLNHFQAEIG